MTESTVQHDKESPVSGSLPMSSVIIAAYNSGHCLGQTLDSIQAQSMAPGEVIVVDDGSSDNTQAVAERFEGPVPVRVLRSPENRGKGASVSRGVRAARHPRAGCRSLPHLRPQRGWLWSELMRERKPAERSTLHLRDTALCHHA